MSSERSTIVARPDSKIITSLGQSHFQSKIKIFSNYFPLISHNSNHTGISDALAEFIDNSIMACDRLTEKNIELKLHFSNKNGFLTICDNGCGMNYEELKGFATFAWDPASRNAYEGKDTLSCLSKYGVGAKQAFAFLGKRMTTITKKKNESHF